MITVGDKTMARIIDYIKELEFHLSAERSDLRTIRGE